jgi:hypothetical protein
MCITDLLFADDAEFVATSPKDLQFMMRAFDEITIMLASGRALVPYPLMKTVFE